MEEIILRSPIVDKNKKLDRALERIYKKYGGDLPAFFRDVEEELTHNSQETQNANILRHSELDHSR